MLFLVEMDYATPGAALTPELGRAFVEQVILPTIARAEQLNEDGTIVAGGPVVGRIALRFMIEAETSAQADRVVSSLALWPLARTLVTPLVTLAERRKHVQDRWA
ncbi:MAG: muconolactone Delta-isomerase family protein [Gemmatimonadota bacterium]